ncbi:unnamed protein product [Protopolystoma xenopodis]|uniref:Uncharacterized protein n=1 Tax=Protopolystoma xenopodis TaxID=117903 RepID=A0A3S5FH63_9PLAT|nr:unnamed protein product [Protopolystoma xenopodis]
MGQSTRRTSRSRGPGVVHLLQTLHADESAALVSLGWKNGPRAPARRWALTQHKSLQLRLVRCSPPPPLTSTPTGTWPPEARRQDANTPVIAAVVHPFIHQPVGPGPGTEGLLFTWEASAGEMVPGL